MATRTITGTILKPNGEPWAGGVVRISLLNDTFRLAPDQTFPTYRVETTADNDGVVLLTLVSGLNQPYRVTLPDRETFDIVVPDGAPTTLELLRADYDASPVPPETIASVIEAIADALYVNIDGDTMTGPLRAPIIDAGGQAINVTHPDFGAVGDGVTDDTAAFEAAFAAGKHVVVPGLNGEVYIVDRLDGIQSGTMLEGLGHPTLMVKPGSTSSPMLLSINAVNDVTVRGITFDGNTSDIVSFNNVTLVFDSGNVTFAHCRFQHCEGIASFVGGTSTNVSYLHCEFEDCGQSVFLVSGTPSDRKQALAFSAIEKVRVEGCDFKDIGLDCISVAGGCSNAHVLRNRIDTNYAGSIFISNCATAAVAGNIVLGSGGNGIDCIDSTDVSIADNVLIGCQAAGIGVFDDCHGVSVSGNVCKNNAQDAASTHKGGITLHATTGTILEDVEIAGNVCYDDQGAGNVTQRYAIGVVSPDGAAALRNIRISDDNLLTGYSAAGNPDDASVFQATLVRNPFRDVELVDHFMTGLSAPAAIGDLSWHAGGTGTGTRAIATPLAGRPGVVVLSTGVTSASTSFLRLFNAVFGVMLPAERFDARFSFQLQDNDANAAMRVGLSNDGGAGNPPTDGIYLEKLAADTQWFGVTRNAGTQTRTAALATCDTNWHQIRIRRVNATTIGFTLDSGAEVTLVTNVPTIAVQPFHFIVNSAAAQKRLQVSRFRMTIEGLAF